MLSAYGLRSVGSINLDRLQAEVRVRIRDLLLDHVSQRGNGAGYDHHDYKPEMRTSMETWADRVEGLVSAKGVALLR